MSGFYLPTESLPTVVQRALSSVGYKRKDIEVHIKDRASLRPCTGNGFRGFIAHCLLGPHARRTVPEPMLPNTFRVLWGSWGGSNAFVQSSVDDDPGVDDLDVDECYLVGREGGGRPVSADLYISEAAAQQHGLRPVAAEVSEREANILATFCRFNAKYRKEVQRQHGVTDAEMQSLAGRGFVQIARNGATRITTAGKNAGGHIRRPFGEW